MLSNIETRTRATLGFFALSNKASFRIFMNARSLGLRFLNAKGDSNSGWLGSFNKGCLEVRLELGLVSDFF